MTSNWARWAMPSMADLVFVAVFGALVFSSLSVKLLGDAGTGWHIRTGQLIVSTHSIPRVDPFSSQIQKPWVAWEWFYDVVVGELERVCGLNGVVWFTALVIAATFAIVFRLLLRRGTDLISALLLTLLAIAASMIHFLARPHVLSWLFAVLWFWILDSVESSGTEHTRRLWILPPLMLIWVNVHGGFLLGFVLLVIYWVGSIVSWVRLKEERIEEAVEKIAAGKRVWRLTLVGIACAIASLINPYGWHLHVHIYEYLTNSFFMNHIDEFQSPNFHGVSQRCFLILLLITVTALAGYRRKLRFSHLLLGLFAVYCGLYASRNIPVSSVFLVLIVGPLLLKVGWGDFSQRMRHLESGLRGNFWPVLICVASLIIALNGGHVGSKALMDAHFDPQRMPVGAVDFVERSGVRGPVFSPDYWGGYLIFRLYPHTHVVIDDRHDFYGQDFLSWYLSAMRAEPRWLDFLEFRNCLILPRKAAVTTLVSSSSIWKPVYSDDVAVVFELSKIPEDRDRTPSQ